jgi:hypothetical protein
MLTRSFIALCIALVSVPASAKKFDESALSAYLEAEFPKKVIAPALGRMLGRVFRDDAEGRSQARAAIQAALSAQARQVREHLSDAVEALVNKDRAAFDSANAKLLESIMNREGFWRRAVAAIMPDLAGRARPLARVGVARNYSCDARFLGIALGLAKDPAEAAKLARKIPRAERRQACGFVRRWAEKKAVEQAEQLVQDMAKALKGEAVDIGKEGEDAVRMIRRVLERDLIGYIGQYQESMNRVRSGLERLAEELPRPPPKAPAAEPAPVEKKEGT